MFALPGLLALLVAHYTRVHEISDLLRTLPVMNTLYLATCFGLLVDVRLGLLRAEACPQLRLVLALWLWTLVSVVLTGGWFVYELNATLVYILLFLLVAQSLQSFRALRLAAIALLAISLFLGAVTFVQRLNPFQCILLVASAPADSAGRPDGRPCDTTADCRTDAEPGEDYLCERPGPFHTTSVAHGRLRYRGVLQDPNELSLALVIALPFAMSIFAQRRSLLRIFVVVLSFAIAVPVVIWTASRTGQIAFVAVVAAYFLRRVRLRGLLVIGMLAAPALLLGGRSGTEADASAMERLEAWYAGIEMFRSSPIWGIGKSQFIENYYLTAHNSFLLEAAEIGLIGMILWVAVFYTSFKIVVSALRRYRDRPDAILPYTWARALLASLCGVAVGTSFLSLAYHPMIWTFFALPGAFYLATRRHDPDFHVGFGVRDLLGVTGFAVLWLVGIKAYLILRGV